MPEPQKLGDVATKLLFENDRVRVWEMDLAPGESSDYHEHTLPYLMCIVEGERIDAEFDDGNTIEIPVEPGQVLYVEPGIRETAINNTSVRFREILVELKG